MSKYSDKVYALNKIKDCREKQTLYLAEKYKNNSQGYGLTYSLIALEMQIYKMSFEAYKVLYGESTAMSHDYLKWVSHLIDKYERIDTNVYFQPSGEALYKKRVFKTQPDNFNIIQDASFYLEHNDTYEAVLLVDEAPITLYKFESPIVDIRGYSKDVESIISLFRMLHSEGGFDAIGNEMANKLVHLANKYQISLHQLLNISESSQELLIYSVTDLMDNFSNLEIDMIMALGIEFEHSEVREKVLNLIDKYKEIHEGLMSGRYKFKGSVENDLVIDNKREEFHLNTDEILFCFREISKLTLALTEAFRRIKLNK